MLSVEDMEHLLSQIVYKDHRVRLHQDTDARRYIQVEFERIDVVTGKMSTGKSGKRYVSQHMAKSEFVQLVFGTILALEEHECRENFYYKGRRVFGPHMDVDALWSVANKFDARS